MILPLTIDDKPLGSPLPVLDDRSGPTGQAAYSPFTGEGYNPRVVDFNFTGPNGIENLRLRDKQGRITNDFVPSLPQMIESIHVSALWPWIMDYGSRVRATEILLANCCDLIGWCVRISKDEH
jgi:hypothetical protein